MTQTTIYRARSILTMNPAQPRATHVAVRDGRILGAGPLEALTGWGPYELDERFAELVLMPGLVEGHSHVMEGSMWSFAYCGYFDRTDPEGRTWPGNPSIEAVVERLQRQARETERGDADAPVTGWGVDPIHYGSRRISRADLDAVSTERPVGILHASGHIINVNTRALEMAGLLRSGVDHPGIPLGDDGLPTGEMKGPEAMTPVGPVVGLDRQAYAGDAAALRRFARLCVRTGVTTATDLAAMLTPESVAMMSEVTGEADYPARIVALRRNIGVPVEQLVANVQAFKSSSHDRLRLGAIKIHADGSIQGFSARMRWPGYYDGAPNGLWYTPPEQMRETYRRALETGIQVHTHANGDEAIDLVLDSMAWALERHPVADHRFTIQHGQLADAAQLRRARALGMCVNLFPNHHFYWGDQHRAMTVGPERAERMNPCATALALGVPLAIHSDAPITPLGPLFTAWCAVNRLTASGRVLGHAERIPVADALRTITLGAAYTLHLDGEIGSIECGKQADFAVLHDDPEAVGAEGSRTSRSGARSVAGASSRPTPPEAIGRLRARAESERRAPIARGVRVDFDPGRNQGRAPRRDPKRG
ncbi:MAG: amidohydrolase [Burkholderiaceae bacterium]